jgi:hypothetical protein
MIANRPPTSIRVNSLASRTDSRMPHAATTLSADHDRDHDKPLRQIGELFDVARRTKRHGGCDTTRYDGQQAGQHARARELKAALT